jgi:hypothetical protein
MKPKRLWANSISVNAKWNLKTPYSVRDRVCRREYEENRSENEQENKGSPMAKGLS